MGPREKAVVQRYAGETVDSYGLATVDPQAEDLEKARLADALEDALRVIEHEAQIGGMCLSSHEEFERLRRYLVEVDSGT